MNEIIESKNHKTHHFAIGSMKKLLRAIRDLFSKKARFLRINPFIVKIDIEGFEDELFSKNTEWMKVFYLITLEIHDWMLPRKSVSKNLFREHSKESRDCYLKGDMVFSIKN